VVEGWMNRFGCSSTSRWLRAARERLLDAHLTVDMVVDAVVRSGVDHNQGQGPTAAWNWQRQQTLELLLADLGRGDDRKAEARARELLSAGLSRAGGTMTVEGTPRPELSATESVARAVLALSSARRGWEEAPAAQENAAGSSTAVPLLPAGSLPGTADAAAQVAPRGYRPFHRLSLRTREAIQVTVAVAVTLPVAYWISPLHYSWALMAVFIVFLGTSTRGETTVKAVQRVSGTAAGIVMAVPLTALIRGTPLAVIVVALLACFVGYYMMDVSYSSMVFCITVTVLQLYDMMHAFSPDLVLLRLVETVMGSAVAVLVACLVLPTSTRDTTAYVRRGFFEALGGMLAGIADDLEASRPVDAGELAGRLRAVENQARRHAVALAPLRWHPSLRSRSRARVQDYLRCAGRVRCVVGWLTTSASAPAAPTVEELRALAHTAHALATVDPPVDPDIELALSGVLATAPGHPLARLRQSLNDLRAHSASCSERGSRDRRGPMPPSWPTRPRRGSRRGRSMKNQ
jgi:uncharacterized membrane protein YccC